RREQARLQRADQDRPRRGSHLSELSRGTCGDSCCRRLITTLVWASGFCYSARDRPGSRRPARGGRMVRTGSRARALVTMMGAASLLATGAASAQQAAPMPRPSVNLYGQPGLIDLPSAEMMPDGEVTGSYSYFGGTHRRNLTFQVLPRLSATVRHATIADWGEPGDPSEGLTDRSLDLTFL